MFRPHGGGQLLGLLDSVLRLVRDYGCATVTRLPFVPSRVSGADRPSTKNSGRCKLPGSPVMGRSWISYWISSAMTSSLALFFEWNLNANSLNATNRSVTQFSIESILQLTEYRRVLSLGEGRT